MRAVNIVIIFGLVSSFLTILVLSAEEAAIDCNAIKCSIAEYDPVCAYDPNRKCYKTFNGGSCEVIMANCQKKDKPYKIVKKGPCCPNTDTPSCDCPEFCPMIYSPVCACNNDGCTTFGNECEMNVQNCKYNYGYKVRYYGECSQTYDPPTLPTYSEVN